MALLQLLLSSRLESGHNPNVRKMLLQCAGAPWALPLGRSVASLPDSIIYRTRGELQSFVLQPKIFGHKLPYFSRIYSY